MPFMDHPQFHAPPDDTVIWRYMELPRLLQMLESGSLYFAVLAEFEDKWEGVLDRTLTEALTSQFSVKSNQVIGAIQLQLKQAAVNCWTHREHESIAMWHLYTSSAYGVAVKTTVGNVKQALEKTNENIHIGRVVYQDHSATTRAPQHHPLSTIFPLFEKRMCFDHENEIRLFTILLPPIPKRFKAGVLIPLTLPAHGTLIQVDLGALILSITTGPKFPSDAKATLESALRRAGINPAVNSSDVALAPPPGGFIFE